MRKTRSIIDIFQRKNVKDKKNESMTMFLFISKYVILYGVTAILVHLGLGPCKPNTSLAWFSWPSLSFSHPSMFQGQLQTHITSSKKVPSCCWRGVKQWVLSLEFWVLGIEYWVLSIEYGCPTWHVWSQPWPISHWQKVFLHVPWYDAHVLFMCW